MGSILYLFPLQLAVGRSIKSSLIAELVLGKGKKAIGAASSIEKALAGHGYRLYYAKGVGLVEQSQPSLKLKLRLAGCRN